MSRSFTAKPGAVAERRINDELLLVPIGSDIGKIDSLFTLNETAALVWEKAKTGAGEEDIQSALVEAFEVAPPEAERDVAEVLDQLVALGALTVTGEAEV